jgi:hypothetical protein
MGGWIASMVQGRHLYVKYINNKDKINMSVSTKSEVCLALLIGQEKSPASPFSMLDRFTVIEIAKSCCMPVKSEEIRYHGCITVTVFRDPDTGEEHSVGDDGSHYWYKNGLRHREDDKPSVICADGSRYWYKNGFIHRDGDEPAIIFQNGTRLWYKKGLRHREDDKPSVMCADGSCMWYKNGVFIRLR